MEEDERKDMFDGETFCALESGPGAPCELEQIDMERERLAPFQDSTFRCCGSLESSDS